MNRLFFIFFSLLTDISFSYAQTANVNLNDVATPSANASSLATLGQYNVDFYSGRLNYYAKINDFTISKVKIPIGLDFSSSGIKVQDVDGAVGIAWKLKAGGVITRNIQSLPDESTYGYCGPNRTGAGNYGYFNNPNKTWANNVMNNDNTKTTWDSEPDKFYFSFLGFSGVFMMDPDGNPVLQSSYGLKIIYCPFNRVNGRMSGGNEDWIISDMAGNQYYFGDGAIETNNITLNGQTSKNTFTYNYISSWYLIKIVTTDNQLINFQYQSFPQQSYTNYLNVRLAGINNNQAVYSNYNENTTISIPTPIYLNKIVSPTYELDFIYNQISPYNNQNSPYLTQINALQNGILEYQYQLNYIPVIYTGFYTRQFLSNIKQLSVLNANPITLYNFGYNTSQFLPLHNSIQTDYWGYYNSNQGSSDIEGYNNGDKTADPIKTAANMLTSVTNTLGGTTNFSYEQNDYNNGATTLMGGLRIRTISTTENGLLSNTEQYSYQDPVQGISSGQQFGNPYNNYQFLNPNTYYFSQSISGISDLSGVEVGYSWVTVSKADGGSIRYHFTNFSDYADVGQENVYYNSPYLNTATDPKSDVAYSPNYPQTSYSFARGKLISEEDIDAHQNVVNKKINTYTISTPINDVVWIKIYPWNKGIPGEVDEWAIHKADFSTQDLLLTSKSETNNYYANGLLTGSSTTTENYTYTTYAGNNLLASKTSILSNGNTQKTTYRYPFNILTNIPSSISTPNLPVSYLVQNNIIGQPLEEVTSVINKNTGIETLMGVDLTTYYATSTGTLVKPSAKYRLMASQSLLKSSYQNYSVTPGSGSETQTIDPNLEPVQLFTQYDSAGNLIETDNPYTSNGQTASLWGYGMNYPIAKAKNAKSTELYYNSFEESTLSNVLPGAAHTGTHYYSGTTYTVGWTIPDAKSYVISYWYLNGSTWKYSGVQPYIGNSMVLSNGAGYDDICIYPSDALVTGYTYEPLVGMTSSEDSKGQTVSYQYDDFKRLINVLDMNGNIVKNYNYYIQGQ